MGPLDVRSTKRHFDTQRPLLPPELPVCDRQIMSTEPVRLGNSPRPIAIDLFSGAGGLSMGFEQAGFDIVAAVEYDPVHAATHLFNFPRCAVLCRSVSNLSGSEIIAAAREGFAQHQPSYDWPGTVDAIIGGPPCQGFSAGGKREHGDHRNQLIMEFVRLVEEIRPRTFCLENVSGLLEASFCDIRLAAFQRLRHAGYRLTGTEQPVNAVDFGVPQRRSRVIVLGALEEFPRPLEGDREHVTAKEALQGLPPVSIYPALLHSDEIVLTPGALRNRAATTSVYARELSGLTATPGDLSHPRNWDSARLTNSKRTQHSPETKARFAATRPGSAEPTSRLYRLPVDGPSRTLRAGTGTERGSHTAPRPIHPTQNRVITVREAARLHGYPDWFRFHTTNWHGHRQVGNSVPPPLARAAGEALRATLATAPESPSAGTPLGDPALLRLNSDSARAVFVVVEAELPTPRSRKPSQRTGSFLRGSDSFSVRSAAPY